MFPDDYMAWLIRREQNKDLVREAERERLRWVVNSARSRLLARVVARIGGFLQFTSGALNAERPQDVRLEPSHAGHRQRDRGQAASVETSSSGTVHPGRIENE